MVLPGTAWNKKRGPYALYAGAFKDNMVLPGTAWTDNCLDSLSAQPGATLERFLYAAQGQHSQSGDDLCYFGSQRKPLLMML